MAPEQCDDRPIDARTDVYALGVMAYELLAGRLPFQGKTVTQLLLAHLQQAPPPLSQLVKGIDPELERAIMKALAKAPEDRHADMARFAEALRPVRARLEAAPRPPRPRHRPARPQRGPAGPGAGDSRPPPPAAPRAGPGRSAWSCASGDATRQLVAVEVTRGGLFLGAETDLPPLFSRVALTRLPPGAEGQAGAERRGGAPRLRRRGGPLAHGARLRRAAGGADARSGGRPSPTWPRPPAAPRPPAPAAPAAPDLRRAAARAGGAPRRPPTTPSSACRSTPSSPRSARRPASCAPGSRPSARAPRPPTSTPAPPPCSPGSTSPSTRSRSRRSGWSTTPGAATTSAWPAAWPPASPRPSSRGAAASTWRATRSRPGRRRATWPGPSVARKMKNHAAAVTAYEAALTADPLDLATLEAYVAFRRQGG